MDTRGIKLTIFKNVCVILLSMCYLFFIVSVEVHAEESTLIPKGEDYVYGVTSSKETNNYIAAYKVDENDVITKSFVNITNSTGAAANILDINCLGMREDGFYSKSNMTTRMRHIDWNGVVTESWDAVGLEGAARSGTFLPKNEEGKQFFLTTSDLESSEKKLQIYIYDVDTKTLVSKKNMINKTSTETSLFYSMGDIVADADGHLYAVVSEKGLVNTKVLKIEVDTGIISAVLPVPNILHSPSITFMKDGRLILADTSDKGAIVDFAVGKIMYTDKTGIDLPSLGGTQTRTMDFASLNLPKFHVDLLAEKFAPETANYGETFEYQFKVVNSGNFFSLDTRLKDNLPKQVEYVSNSTKVNGKSILDVSGTSPIFSSEGLLIYSKDNEDNVLVKDIPAMVSFKVKVIKKGDISQPLEIPNLATVTASDVSPVETNKVITKVPGLETKIYVKQEVINENAALISPKLGFGSLWNNEETYTMTIPSFPADTNETFKKIILNSKDVLVPYKLSLRVPEFYSYDGYQSTTVAGDHVSSNRLKGKIENIDFSKNNTYWLTVYITPKMPWKLPPMYNWDYKVNDFDKIAIK